MRIALIRPKMESETWSPTRFEPLALGILAALTPASHQVVLRDEYIGDTAFAPDVDLAAVTVGTFSAARAYAIAARYRECGIPVVMGGFHPTLMPEEARKHADAVVVGDAEASWPRVLEDLEAGRLQPLYSPGDAPAPPAVAPDRSLFAGKRYLPARLIQFGRGCPRTCEFCSVRAFYRGQVTHRPVDEVIGEMRTFGPGRVFIVDDNLMADRELLKQLMEAMIPLKIRWASQMDLGIADDPELLSLATRSGCQSLTIGFESLDARNLEQMGKRWNREQTYSDRLQRLRAAGIMVYGTFLFGYDQDNAGSIERTLDFAMQEGLFLANFNPLQPIPGSPLYDRLQQEDRLVHDRWWLDSSYRWHEALVRPRNMTPLELSNGCRRAREKFHSFPSMIRRLFSPNHRASLSNLALFLAANLISRMDIRIKTRAGRSAP